MVLHLLHEIFTVVELHQHTLENMIGMPSELARDTARLQQIEKGISELEAMFADDEPPPDEEKNCPAKPESRIMPSRHSTDRAAESTRR
jgi:hypothetical protein